MGQIWIGVARGDDLTLLRHAEAALDSARGLRADGAIGRAATARHCAPTAMKERERDAVAGADLGDALPGADLGDALLRLVQRPVCGQVAAVFVAVGVTDHHHLFAAPGRQMGLIHGQAKQALEDTG